MERNIDFKVTWVRNGQDALAQLKTQTPDICILDVMMPVMDGFTLAKKIKLTYPDIPVMFLTARAQTADVVKGFESGGNDYLKKPFSIEELEIRVRELLRRNNYVSESKNSEEERYEFGRYVFIPAVQSLKCDTIAYQLSNKEAELLRALVKHKNSVLERKEVLIKLWGDDNFFNARNMDVYIGKLRKYLAHDSSLSIINIRGYGFKLIEQKE